MTNPALVLPWQDLHDFAKRVFVRVGLPEQDAVTEADTLLWANLRGVDSHGVVRISWYVENTHNGIMNPTPDIRVTVETPAIALIVCTLRFQVEFNSWVKSATNTRRVPATNALNVIRVYVRSHAGCGSTRSSLFGPL